MSQPVDAQSPATAPLRRAAPFRDWLAKYEQTLSERLDRTDNYLKEDQQQGDLQWHLTGMGPQSSNTRASS
jgi:hypothetical protein